MRAGLSGSQVEGMGSSLMTIQRGLCWLACRCSYYYCHSPQQLPAVRFFRTRPFITYMARECKSILQYMVEKCQSAYYMLRVELKTCEPENLHKLHRVGA